MKPFDSKPIRIYCPDSGTRWLIRWSSYDDGSHLIIAPSRKSAEFTLEKAAHSYSDIKSTEFFKVEFVAPSNLLNKLNTEKFWEEEKEIFKLEVISWCRELETLPAGIKRCENYQPVDEYHSEWGARNHIGCINCYDGIVFNPYEIFENNYTSWKQTAEKLKYTSPYKPFKKKELPFSKAPQASDDETIYAVSFDYHGIIFIKLEQPSITTDNIPTEFAFLFRLIEEINQESLQSILSNVAKERLKNKEMAERHYASREKDRSRKRAEIINEFLVGLK